MTPFTPSAGLRAGLGATCTLHAAVFAACALVLPWKDQTQFAFACGALSAGHVLVAVAAVIGHRRLCDVWRVVAWASWLFLAWMVVTATWSGVYIAEVYGGLGRGIAAAMAAAMGTVALFTLPFACWGLVVCGAGFKWTRARGLGGVLLVIAGSIVGCTHAQTQAKATPLLPAGVDVDRFEQALSAGLRGAGISADADSALVGAEPWLTTAIQVETTLKSPLRREEPLRCSGPPEMGRVQVLAVAGSDVDPQARRAARRCFEGTLVEVSRDLAAWVSHRRSENSEAPVQIDLVTGAQALPAHTGLLSGLVIRPGLDGICVAGNCLAPWQLVALDQFRTAKPIPAIHDLRVGVSMQRLRGHLGRAVLGAEGETPTAEQLVDGAMRITTAPFLVDGRGRVVRTRRMKAAERPVNPDTLGWAMRAAELHISTAQHPRGVFRYTLDPHSGRANFATRNLPRQAGTTLVTCELARDRVRARATATKALGWMANFEVEAGAGSALLASRSASKADLGPTALPLIAFLSCRPLVGERFDPLIGRLAQVLLAMQREDGGFHPKMSVPSGRVVPGPEPLYAGGQAVYALTLLEAAVQSQAQAQAIPGWPEHARLRSAVEAAMNYVANDYWSHAMADFFYIEENWHCLAARASLGHHRHPGYEQFCRDYVAYKRRLILDSESGVQFDFEGGYGFGNIVAPHNTGSSGFLEALAADLAIAQARGETISDSDRALALRVIGFLLRQQWNPDNCTTCAPGAPIIGGFSESMSAPPIRIDFVQHAWAGIGHTARVLGLMGEEPAPTKGVPGASS